jgi:glycosyltransferase involved in cell wall biosynthesis
MHVLVVEPYYGGSHRAWADGYRDHSAHEITLVTHPARFWKWRMHGGFLTLAEEVERTVRASGPPDVIVVSSMLDIAAFAGAIRSTARGVPIAAYFHESQFTYPLSPADRTDLAYPMKNWTSAATADLAIFNSGFHRDVFRSEATVMLNDFPDHTHVHRVPTVLDRAIVVPVGVEADALAALPRRSMDPPLVLWNHRWEHDKGPEELLEIVRLLVDSGAPFSMAMCGEVFVSVPPTYADVVELLGDRLVHEGWASRDRYVELLASASVVLSTAIQEFFGIGVVEGIAAGAHPVLPRRLVYPERVSAMGAEPSRVLYDDPAEAVGLILAALSAPEDPALRSATHMYDWSVVAPQLDAALSALGA